MTFLKESYPQTVCFWQIYKQLANIQSYFSLCYFIFNPVPLSDNLVWAQRDSFMLAAVFSLATTSYS